MAEEKEREKPAEEKVNELFLLQAGVSFEKLKDLAEFCEGIQNFVQYLGTNQYYSDSVNKKIFLLTLDVDALLLRLGHLSLVVSSFKERKLEELLRKKKDLISDSEVESFRKDCDAFEKAVSELHDRAFALTEDIREDYKRKDIR